MKTEIIKILTKYQTTNPEYVREMHNSMVIDPMDYHKIAKELLQALEEEPFLGCDTCIYCKHEKDDSIWTKCYRPHVKLMGKRVNKTTSCIHHSKRKDKK